MAFSILALGGCGDMGRHAAKMLAQSDFVTHLLLAGIDDDRSRRFAASLGDKARFQPVDIANADDLDALMASADLVVNTAGPFFKLGALVTDSAIRTKRPYFDICDDVEPTLALLNRSADAKAAGIPMIVGLGLSPGITNLLARMAADSLDEVHSLDTTWDLSGTVTVGDGYERIGDQTTSAALVHWMHVCSGKTRILDQGVWCDVRPVEPVPLHLSATESLTGWSVTHPEAVTLPLTYPDLKGSRNFMTGQKTVFDLVRLMRDHIDAGELTCEAAADALAVDHNLAASMSSEEECAYRARKDQSRPYLSAIAQGTKDGKTVRASVRINRLPPGGMGASTGLPVAIGAQMYAEGMIKGAGVFTPESLIDPAAFFERFEPYCDPALDGRPLVEITIEALNE
jgi:saccharopine dehydrogenase-like NADP-dependent oxidoreductase